MKNIKIETVQKNIINALQVRIDNAPSANFAENMQTELDFLASVNALAALEKIKSLDFDLQAFAKRLAIHDKQDVQHVAIYAIQKVRKALFAIAQNSAKGFDKYSFSIVKNLATLQALDTLNAQRSICSKIEIDELAQVQAVRVYHNCSPSTASTQASSTRMMLEVLNVCNVSKGKKGDSISFTDSSISKAMQALFA
jgi:hypothetical protein